MKDIPADAFAFFLIDPKGWRIPLRQLEPMLKRPNSEVIFNFMFEFINRAASIEDPTIVSGLQELMPMANGESSSNIWKLRRIRRLTDESRSSSMRSVAPWREWEIIVTSLKPLFCVR